jgi:hypothetical protein
MNHMSGFVTGLAFVRLHATQALLGLRQHLGQGQERVDFQSN